MDELKIIRRKRWVSVKKFLTTLLIVMLLFILGVTTVVTRSLSPYNQAEAETTTIAQERANLAETDEFYWYNGNETFFTVTGTDTEGTPIIVIVQQDGGAVEVVNQEEAISEQTAIEQTISREKPREILEARIGMYNGNPIWEVSFKQDNDTLGYAIFSLTSGEWVRTIKNI